jgi:hypothetical protein
MFNFFTKLIKLPFAIAYAIFMQLTIIPLEYLDLGISILICSLIKNTKKN